MIHAGADRHMEHGEHTHRKGGMIMYYGVI